MTRLCLAVLALFVGVATLAQTTPLQRAEKARAEVNELKNGAARALYALDQLIADLNKGTLDPTPAPAPSSTPSPPAPVLPLSGVDKVASKIDVAKFLQPSWGSGALPTSAAPDPIGAFRFICSAGQLAYDDPIVYPGQPGKSHLHQFFGNTLANASSTYHSLRTTGDSTCNNVLNRSAYWISAMIRPDGKVVRPDYVSIYYKRFPSSSALCQTMGKACLPLPRGLRYIFGYNMLDPQKSDPAHTYWWSCDGPGAVGGMFRNIPQAAKGCPAGARIGVRLEAPQCWNGKDLDSADHRSHMAFTNYNGGDGVERCPKTHPYVLPKFELAAWYAVDETLDRSGNEDPDARTWHLSSDRMSGMAPAVPGTTIHTDWFGAWEDSVMDLWMANCIDKLLSCSGGDLGNRQQMTLLKGYSLKAEPRLMAAPPAPRI